VDYGNFIGIEQTIERKGIQWDIHYRIMGQDRIEISDFVDRSVSVTLNKQSTEHRFEYSNPSRDSQEPRKVC